MGKIATITVPVPPDLQPTPQGAETQGQAYALLLPTLASDPLIVRNRDGQEFRWAPTELAYRGVDDAGAPAYDFLVGSSPVNVSVTARQARYERIFPSARDVFVAEAEQVKHHTILWDRPRDPAVYIVREAEFGVSGMVSGVPLPLGLHEDMLSGGFALRRPVVRDAAGAECKGRYEVLDTDGGQQLFVWFPAEWVLSPERVYPLNLDPTVATSTSSTATALSRQRKTGKFTDGVILTTFYDGAYSVFRYSADQAQTWNVPTSGASQGYLRGEGVLLIDTSDRLHFLYVSGVSVVHYLGTPSADKTSITWSSPFTSEASTTLGTLTGCLTYEGSDVMVHVFTSKRPGGTNYTLYFRIRVAAGGTRTLNGTETVIGGPYGENAENDPDGTADPSDNLHVWWSSGVTGAGKGIRYKKATYSAGAWTWGSEQAIDESNHAGNPTYSTPAILSGAIDNSGRCVVAYKKSSDGLLRVMRLSGGMWSALPGIPSVTPTSVSVVTVETDIYVFFTYSGGMGYLKHDGSWGSIVVADSDTTAAYVTACLDTSDNGVDATYTTGSASPYTVKSYRLTLNTAPQAADVAVSPLAFAAAAGADITITHNDTDQMSAWMLKRTVDGVTSWWNNTTKAWDQTSEYWNTGSGMSVTIAAADNAGKWTAGKAYQLQAATRDSFAMTGPYTTTPVVAFAGDKPMVTVTGPGDTVTAGSAVVEWTPDMSQGAYQVRLLDAAGATELQTTGKQADATARARTISGLDNGTSYQAEVTVWDQSAGDGIASDPAAKAFAVSFTPPTEPAVTVIPNADQFPPHIQITATNPTPVDPQPAVTGNRIERSTSAAGPWTSLGTCDENGTFRDYSAASGQMYYYRAVALGTNETETAGTVRAGSVTRECWWFVPRDTPANAVPFVWNREASWTYDRAFTEVETRGPATVHFVGGKKRDVLPISAMFVNATTATPHPAISLTKEGWRQRFRDLCFVQGYLLGPDDDNLAKRGILEPPSGSLVRDMVVNATTISVRFVEKGEVP